MTNIDTLTQRVAEAIGEAVFETHGFASSEPFTDAAQAAIEASGAQHLQGFNLLSEKKPEVGEYCLCLCDSGDYNGIYFCTSKYHGLKNEATCGFYCHSVVAWMGESQMRNMARDVLAALSEEVRGER